MLLSMKFLLLLWGLSVLVESDSVTGPATQRMTPTQVATVATPRMENKDAIAVNKNGSSSSAVTDGATPRGPGPQIPHGTDSPAPSGATPPIRITVPATAKPPGNQPSQNTSLGMLITHPPAGDSIQTSTVMPPKSDSDLKHTLAPPARMHPTTHGVFSTVPLPILDTKKQNSSQVRDTGASNTSSSTSILSTTIAPGNIPTSKSTNSSLVMDPSHPGTTNSSVLMDSSNPGTHMPPKNTSTPESTNSTMIMDSSKTGTHVSPKNTSTSESTNSSVVNTSSSESTNSSIIMDSSKTGTHVPPKNTSTSESTNSSMIMDSSETGTHASPKNTSTLESTNSSMMMDSSETGTHASPKNTSTSESTNSSVVIDSSNSGTTMPPNNISTSKSTNSSIKDSSNLATTMSPTNMTTSESTNSSVEIDSSNSSSTISPGNATTSESTNSSILIDSSNSGTTISPRNVSNPRSTSSTIPDDSSNSTTSNSSILIPPKPKTPAIRPNPGTTTAPKRQPPSTNVQSCNSRALVKQSLIVIAILAALATIFMVSTIALCVKLSTRRYRLKRSQQGTEMICISSLLPESRYNYTRQRTPVRNGVRVIHTEDDSDEDVSDNFTLSSFLPDNERYL